jgi:hypothetical protein
MTISEALSRANQVKPNTYADVDKIRWLSTLDGFIKTDIIDTHEGGEDVVFNGYDENTNLATELLVPAPHDHIYVHWLEAQIDYANDEYDRYENTMDMYNTAYDNFKKYYNRTHMPKGKKFKFF